MLKKQNKTEESKKDGKGSEKVIIKSISYNVPNPRDYIKYATNPHPAKIEIHSDETGKPKIPVFQNANVLTPVSSRANGIREVCR